MKKQLLTVIALGSLINVQAADEITTAAIAAIGAQDAALGARAAAQAAQVTSEKTLRGLANLTATLAAQGPKQVVKETILEQVQRLGYKGYAAQVFEQAKNIKFEIEAVPYFCCMTAGYVLEPVVTKTARWAQRAWTGQNEVLRHQERAAVTERELLHAVAEIEERNACPDHAHEKLLVISDAMNQARNDIATIAEVMGQPLNAAIAELRLVCQKINRLEADVANQRIEEIDRSNTAKEAALAARRELQNRPMRATDAEITAMNDRVSTTSHAAVNTLIANAAKLKKMQDQVLARARNGNREARNNAANLFPTPTAANLTGLNWVLSCIRPSELNKRCLYKFALGNLFYAGYKFITS